MNILFHFQGIVYQAKCIQWEKNRYELQLNADRTRIDEQAVVGAYKKYLGQDANVQVTYVDEIPVQASGKRMVCENRCPDYQ
jgi:phenylacetate-CoA ligase